MKSLDSFLRDTKHCLNVVEDWNKDIEDGTLNWEEEGEENEVGFQVFDIEGMYPSIPKELGMAAAEEYLDSRPEILDPSSTNEEVVSTNSVMDMLEASLDNNYFEFNEENYQQHGGTAIGPKVAPLYACLAIGKLEKDKMLDLSKFRV